MTVRKKLILAIASIVVIAMTVGAFRVYRFVDYSLESPRIAVFSSPDKSRSAYLIWHDTLMARTLTLLVSPSNSENDLRWIGSVESDDSLMFTELVWSADSNLVAARCSAGEVGA